MDKIKKTDAEWRADLSDSAYRVTRQHGMEEDAQDALSAHVMVEGPEGGLLA